MAAAGTVAAAAVVASLSLTAASPSTRPISAAAALADADAHTKPSVTTPATQSAGKVLAQAARRAVAVEQLAARRAAARAAAQRAAAADMRADRAEARAAAARTPQQIAMAMLGQFGWSQSQFGCLDALWNRESNWNTYASNPSSGAYGIPQALPGGKMASAGPDWQTNPATQIRWGLGYIQSSYGSPCGAWGHESAYGWY